MCNDSLRTLPIILCDVAVSTMPEGIREQRYCGFCGSLLERAETTEPEHHVSCARCGRITQAAGPSVLVMTTVMAEERMLLLKRGQAPYRDSWAPPGGFVEAGESLEQAAVREIYEEVGLVVPSEKLLPHGIISLPALNQVYVLFIALIDEASPLQPQLPEALDAGWFSEADFPRRDIWTPAQKFQIGLLFERARTGHLDIYQHSDTWFRLIRNNCQIEYLWQR